MTIRLTNILITLFPVLFLTLSASGQISNIILSDRVVDWTDSGGGVYIGSGG